MEERPTLGFEQEVVVKRREFVMAATGALAAAPVAQAAVMLSVPPGPSPSKSGYVDVNGLHMYYERHGQGGVPLVLLHGGFSAIGTSFGALLPGLSAKREVIAFELQGHGHTADIDRPLSYEAMAGDIAAALEALHIPSADVFGYSVGGVVALQLALQHPDKVRRLVILSATYRRDGIQPGLMDNLGKMQPAMMHGTPWYEEYEKIAPRPEDFDRLFAKKNEMDKNQKDIPDDAIRGLKMPVLLIAGDNDLPTLEHMAKFYRLLGGGGFGDMPPGLPKSRLAILPGTSHVTAPSKKVLLLEIIPDFLDG